MFIRKMDNNNFVLAKKLDKPREVTFKGNKVIYEYKNLECYFGSLYGALTHLFKKENVYYQVPDRFKQIKPNSSEELYMPFLEVGVDEIIAKLIKGD